MIAFIHLCNSFVGGGIAHCPAISSRSSRSPLRTVPTCRHNQHQRQASASAVPAPTSRAHAPFP
eukprot:45129-Amphidinium_carterae.1